LNNNLLILFGEIVNTRGLKGELKTRIYNPASSLLKQGTVLYCNTNKYTIRSISSYKNFFYIFLDTITSLEDAKKLKGHNIFVAREAISVLEGEQVLADIIGFRVIEENQTIGIVGECTNFGAGNILVIKQDKTKEYMIPYNNEYIIRVDHAHKTIYVQNTKDLRGL